MKMSWLSLVVGIIVILASGPAIGLWLAPILTALTMHEASSPPSSRIVGVGLVCLSLSVLGLVLGILQVRHGIKPRWAGITGIALGVLNSGAWTLFLLFVGPQFMHMYRALGGK